MDTWATEARQRIKDEYQAMLMALRAWRAAELSIRDVIEGLGTQSDLAEKQLLADAEARKLLKLVSDQVL